MSAIWGTINLAGQDISKTCAAQMSTPYEKYKLDRISGLQEQNVYMACGQQYIAPTDAAERMPYHDKKKDIFFTADCVIDNRRELIEELGVSADIPNGQLMYAAYEKWGEACSSHLLGAYAYAVYDRRRDRVMISADHTFNRAIYYYVRGEQIWFSTVHSAILAAAGETLQMNEQWLIDCITLKSPVMNMNSTDTYYKDVYKIEAGTYVTFEAGKLEKHIFWNPLKNCKEQRWSEEYCKNRLKELLEQSIDSVLCTEAETGISLSSGLDSSTVAGIAALLLKQRGKKLYSFTSVPMKDFQSKLGKRYIVNETEGVLENCRLHPNIEPEFLSCEGKSIFSEYHELVNILEMPTKSQQNAVWLYEIYQAAAQKGCKVFLNGQSGNSLLSAGIIEETIYRYIQSGKLIKAYRELELYCRSRHISRKRYAKYLCREISAVHHRKQHNKKLDVYAQTCVNRSLAEKYHTQDRFRELGYNSDASWGIMSYAECREAMFDVRAFSQIGEYDTQYGLATGLVIRDPIRDKRLLEFFLQVPQQYYAKDGTDRRLVREYLKEILPEAISGNVSSRGLQGADYQERAEKAISQHMQEYMEELKSAAIAPYVDRQDVELLIQNIKHNENADKIVLMYRKMAELLTMNAFLEKFGT